MKVTDEMTEVATTAHLMAATNFMELKGAEFLKQDFTPEEWSDLKSMMKAALEAVFEMQGGVVKDFVDMMEKELTIDKKMGGTYWSKVAASIMRSDEYQALKSSISPVSEDKKGVWKMPTPGADEYDWSKLDHGLYKIYWKDGSCSMASVGSLHSGKRWFAPTNWTSKDHNIASSCWNKVKDVKCIMSNAGFDREEEPEQPTDTQDNDGWISWGGDLLELPVGWKDIEVKFESGELLKYKSGDSWIFKNENVIAYRVIGDNDGWIGHDGGEMPVPSHVKIQ